VLSWNAAGYVAAGVGIYLFWAVVAMLAVRRFAADLSTMEDRISAPVLLIGGIANLLVLLGVTVLVPLLLDKPISSLQLHLSPSGIEFSVLVFIFSFLLAILFLYMRRHRSVRMTALRKPRSVLLGILVLLIVATQEEFLFRGYTRVVLQENSAWSYLLVSTAIFVVIHFFSNKVTLPQVVSWTLGGALLGFVYLVSGSIWTAVILHFAIDAGNVLVFDITGQGGLFEIARPITESERMGYRSAFTGLMILFTSAWYGVNML
jgi:membrane protease YdiL (CAAX protease family)